MAFVFLLCEQQAQKLEIEDDEFEERLLGNDSQGDPILDHASDAFTTELIDFFRRFGQNADAAVLEKQLQSAIETRKILRKAAEDGVIGSLMDEESNSLIDRLLGRLGDTFSNSPESPESSSGN